MQNLSDRLKKGTVKRQNENLELDYGSEKIPTNFPSKQTIRFKPLNSSSLGHHHTQPKSNICANDNKKERIIKSMSNN